MVGTRQAIRHRIQLAIGLLAMAYCEFEHTETGREQHWKKAIDRIMHAIDQAGDALDEGKVLVSEEAAARSTRRVALKG